MNTVLYVNIPYKHRLKTKVVLQTSVFGYDVTTEFIRLFPNGVMEIYPEYMWDGASGPTWDTPNVKVPSAGHDALFQLMRLGLIPRNIYFIKANEDICRWMIERKTFKLRALTWKVGLDLFGKKHTYPIDLKIIEVW